MFKFIALSLVLAPLYSFAAFNGSDVVTAAKTFGISNEVLSGNDQDQRGCEISVSIDDQSLFASGVKRLSPTTVAAAYLAVYTSDANYEIVDLQVTGNASDGTFTVVEKEIDMSNILNKAELTYKNGRLISATIETGGQNTIKNCRTLN